MVKIITVSHEPDSRFLKIEKAVTLYVVNTVGGVMDHE